MAANCVLDVLKLGSEEVFREYLSIEKFAELQEHLKSKPVHNQGIINSLEPENMEFFGKVAKLAKARYFNIIEDSLTNLLYDKQDISEAISRYNNSYDKVIKLKILDDKIFHNLYQIIISKDYNESSWVEIYDLQTEISYEAILANLPQLKNTIIEVLKKFKKSEVCRLKSFEYKNELWIIADLADSVFTSETWENNKLTTRSLLPNKSIIFIVNKEEKSFKMHTDSGKRFSGAMQEAFFRTSLKEDEAGSGSKSSYNIGKVYLDILRNKSLSLNMIEPDIKGLFVNKIILQNINENHPFTPALKNKKADEGIYHVIQKHGLTKTFENMEMMEGERWTPEKMFFTCIYKDGAGKDGYKFFSINSKNDTSLGNDEISVKIRNLLRKNGI